MQIHFSLGEKEWAVINAMSANIDIILANLNQSMEDEGGGKKSNF